MDTMTADSVSIGGAKTCVTTGNASLSLCNVDEKEPPVNVAPMSAEAQKQVEKDLQENAKQDYSSFDIVKATQYGALERVVELVDEKGRFWSVIPYIRNLLFTIHPFIIDEFYKYLICFIKDMTSIKEMRRT